MPTAHSELEQELARIDTFYANELNSIVIGMADLEPLLPPRSLAKAAELLTEESQGSLNKAFLRTEQTDNISIVGQALFMGVGKRRAKSSLSKTTFRRSLVGMSEPERAALRLA